MIDWEETFRKWSAPSSDTEATKANNAERMVHDAIKVSRRLSQRDITVRSQGSYQNNTNVKEDSDIDIYVCCNDIVFPDYSSAPHLNNLLVGLYCSTYTYEEFKSEVVETLYNKFGQANVTEGNKAFDIHANSYRIDADVVPVGQGRLYFEDNGLYGYNNYIQGTCIVSKTGIKIFNWPEQNYLNGPNKNKLTSYKFKFVTRSIKRLRNYMVEKNILAAKPIPSYLIECLVYQIPNYFFNQESYKRIIVDGVTYLSNAIASNTCHSWREVNEIKFLFHDSQSWNKNDVNKFILAAYNFIQEN